MAQSCEKPEVTATQLSVPTRTGLVSLSYPQHHRLPSTRIPHEPAPPPRLTLCQGPAFGTCVGTDRSVVSPTPSSPCRLWPQHHSEPSVRMPQELLLPMATKAQSR